MSCSPNDSNNIETITTSEIEAEAENTDSNSDNTSGFTIIPQTITSPNILLIIADDMGMDATPYATQFSSQKPNMPTLDKLVAAGVRFTNAWAYPKCTPTRASIITGKQAPQTDVYNPGDYIDLTETSIQDYIKTNASANYTTAVFGKWHITNGSNPIEKKLNIDTYKGSLDGGVSDYYNWDLDEDGNNTPQTNYYTTTAYTDYAIDWINKQSTPWFCWLAYNAAHTPFHTPNDDSLFSTETSANSDLTMYLQMLEAMDTEIARLLNSMSSTELNNTTIIFIGDNGTPTQVAQSPFSKTSSKGSLHNGGVNVPLVVAGANTLRANTEDTSLVQSADLFATIADLAGVTNPNANESISFKELLTNTTTHSREFNYAQIPAGNATYGGYTVRNSSYKLNYDTDNNTYYLYDVINDYEESKNLYDGSLNSEEQIAFDTLKTEAERILAL
ncbi:sulfatase-like hydrolase/transferase [Flavobacteriaceae bacterium]|nr:sulfatase-like hydrolase/transferase [Flavobacteriaceae bacterium]